MSKKSKDKTNDKTKENKKVAEKKLTQKAPSEKKYGQIAIENAELEAFENRTRDRRYTIEFSIPEFTCICPRSGFPDFATLYIMYVPDKYCVELKSLKLYINKFRNEPVFHEDITNRILDDLVKLLDPWEIEVVGDFNVRGNIKTVITSTHEKTSKTKK
jgi:7-cyano-7-deazaguanine reductase